MLTIIEKVIKNEIADRDHNINIIIKLIQSYLICVRGEFTNTVNAI